MKFSHWTRLAAGLAVMGALASVTLAGPKEDIANFRKVWGSRTATVLEKRDAVQGLPRTKEAVPDFISVLESDVWQFRLEILGRVLQSDDKDMLAEAEAWLFDEKKASKQPAAAEHLVFAMLRNNNWATPEKWEKMAGLVKSKAMADKVKARILREMGVWRNNQPQAKANVRTLVGLLEWVKSERKPNREMLFLVADSLESLTGESFSDDLERWKFFANDMKDDVPLKPRTADSFKDPLGDIELEGHTFARKEPRRGGDAIDLLILPNLYRTPQYWYPYIFELNKTFNCTFVDLPDCSKMKDLEYLRNRDGTMDTNAYYYPLEQLVEAFEQRRESSGKKTVGLIAHGVSGWIALEYMRLYPQRVEFAIIIQTWSGNNAFSTGRNATENNREQDAAFRNYGKSLQYPPPEMTPEEQYWGQTGNMKRRWADPRAVEPLLYAQKDWNVEPLSNARIIVPKYEFADKNKGKKIDVPVLFIHGTKDPMHVARDMQEYRKTFTRMTWVNYENSADTPWAEEPVRFFDDFEKLLKDHKILERLAGEKKK